MKDTKAKYARIVITLTPEEFEQLERFAEVHERIAEQQASFVVKRWLARRAAKLVEVAP